VITGVPIVLLRGRSTEAEAPPGPASVWPTARLAVEVTGITIGLSKVGTPVLVVVVPKRFTEAMSRFGENKVPDENKIPLPD
jgi:hypothetical protein